MRVQTFGILTATGLVLIPMSVFFVDQPLAYFIAENLGGLQPLFAGVTHFGELATGVEVTKYLPGFIALAIGGGFYVVRKDWPLTRAFVFIGGVFLLERVVAGVLKNVFSRMRPTEMMQFVENTNTFFAPGGSSFPSGHAAHFWGLFVPLMILFPRLWPPLVAVPVLFSVARVIENDHYLGDVMASALLALLIAFAAAKILKVDAVKY